MNLLRKTVALLLAVLLCTAMFTTAFATEADTGDEQGTAETEVPSTGFSEVNETVYAVTHANIRSGPSTNDPIVGILRYGHSITRIGIGADGWSMVLYNDQVAYIYSVLLSYTRPRDFTTNIDDEALLNQIAVANGLTRSDYTDASWAALTSALTNANIALNGNSQNAADAAEQALKDAISALVRMDYSALERTLAKSKELATGDRMGELWFRLAAEVSAAEALLTSGRQTAVNEANNRLLELLDQIEQMLENGETPQVIVQEKPVEVPPTDDYCNIPAHRVWPVMFFVSLALNVTLLAVIAIYLYQKKKNRTDDVPLVDYDIMDDMI